MRNKKQVVTEQETKRSIAVFTRVKNLPCISRHPCLTRCQRETVEANQKSGRPLFSFPAGSYSQRIIHTIVFISTHCVLDFTNGAALATYAGLKTLTEEGYSCKVFCGSRMDAWEENDIEKAFTLLGINYDTIPAKRQTWDMIHRCLKEGKRGLRGGRSLSQFLREKEKAIQK